MVTYLSLPILGYLSDVTGVDQCAYYTVFPGHNSSLINRHLFPSTVQLTTVTSDLGTIFRQIKDSRWSQTSCTARESKSSPFELGASDSDYWNTDPLFCM